MSSPLPPSCASCKHRNPPDAIFCNACGSRLLSTSCLHCGAVLDLNSPICARCGVDSFVARLTPKEQLETSPPALKSIDGGSHEPHFHSALQGERAPSGDLQDALPRRHTDDAATSARPQMSTGSGAFLSSEGARLGRSALRQPGRGYGYRPRTPAGPPSIRSEGAIRESQPTSNVNRVQYDDARSDARCDDTTRNLSNISQTRADPADHADLELANEILVSDVPHVGAIAADSAEPALQSRERAGASTQWGSPTLLQAPQFTRRSKAWLPVLALAVAGFATFAYLGWEKIAGSLHDATPAAALGERRVAADDDKVTEPPPAAGMLQPSVGTDGSTAPDTTQAPIGGEPAQTTRSESAPPRRSIRSLSVAREHPQARKFSVNDATQAETRVTPEPLRSTETMRAPVQVRACTDAVKALGLCDSVPAR